MGSNQKKAENKRIVSLISCHSYDSEEVERAVRASLTLLGGIGSFVSPGHKVALKPNLLRAADADSAVVTHPVFVEAVARIVIEAGGKPFVVDSPGAGIPFSSKSLRRIYNRCGYLDMDERIGLNYDTGFGTLRFPEGRILKQFEIIKPVLDADVIINLPKVKTHGFTYLSCGVKNLFGVVPGLYKSAYHGRFQDQGNFCLMLIDLCMLLKPDLTICDGIVGMEGDGPSNGKRKALGAVAASFDPFLLDLLISDLIRFNPLDVPYLRQAIQEGICVKDISHISVMPEGNLEGFRTSFMRPKTFSSQSLTDRVKRFIILKLLCRCFERLLIVKPYINKDLCRGCGICASGCPRNAIHIVDGCAIINHGECIRCYCCHEFCPYGSVFLERHFVDRFLKRHFYS